MVEYANNNISRTLFIVILLIVLINAILSTANLIEDGVILRRVIPAVSWTIGTIIWIVAYLKKQRRE